MIFWNLQFVLIGLWPSVLASAVLPVQWTAEELDQMTPNNKTTMSRLFSRDVSCTFNSFSYSGSCPNTAYCCWKFIPGADNQSQEGGGFCCTDTPETGGGCCGNSCCPLGQYCAFADASGHHSCVPDSSKPTGYPTVTATVTSTVTRTDTTTIVQTATVTQYRTDVQVGTVTTTATATVTEFKTDIQTNFQTIIQSTTIVQTTVGTTTNSAGQTIIQTFTVSTVSSIASGVPAQASNGNGNAAVACADSNNSPPIGTIVGGVVGGVALLAIGGLFLFAAIRRGWFEKQDRGTPPAFAIPVAATAVKDMTHVTASPQTPSTQQYSRNATSPVQHYELNSRVTSPVAWQPEYSYREMEGDEAFNR